MELVYEKLIADYYDNLNNNLRNFRGGEGFLETWVHDENHNRSLLEIFSLAQSSGVKDLVVKVPDFVMAEVDVEWLNRQLGDQTVMLRRNGQGGYLVLQNNNSPRPSNTITAPQSTDPYITYLQSLRRQEFARPLQSAKSGEVYTATTSGVQLSCAVDTQGVVIDAVHSGAPSAAEANLFDLFSSALVGRTLQEGAEHGVIRLESLIREKISQPRSVKGLQTPDNASSCFALPRNMIRQIYHDYLKANSLQPGKNFWRDPVPKDWLALPAQEMLTQARGWVMKGCEALGLQKTVEVIEIKNDTRFVIHYVQDPKFPNFAWHMIKLESWLRDQLKFEVELQLESLEDRNKRIERTNRG